MPPCETPKIPEILLVLGDWVLTSPEFALQSGAVAITGDHIVEVGSADELIRKFPNARKMGGEGRIVMSGMINTHTHLFQTFLKGLGQGLDLRSWVKSVTTPAALTMKPRDAYLAAMVGLMECIHSGATTIFDYSYAFPNPELYAAELQAFSDLGLRGWLGVGVNDTGAEFGVNPAFIQPAQKSLALVDDLRREVEKTWPDQLSVAITPSSIRGLSKNGIESFMGYVREHNLIFSLHVNETERDNEISQRRFGVSAVPFLASAGALTPELLAVHCVYMQKEDIRLFAKNNVKVSHNPVSNMYLGSGIAPVVEMREAGIDVGLASDGAASNNSQDMLEALKLAALSQRVAYRKPNVFTAKDAFTIATYEGAKALGADGHLGLLAPNYLADLTVLKIDTSKCTPVHDPYLSLVFSCGEENVETVIVGGRIVLDGGHLTTVDEKAILAEAQNNACNLVKRANILQR